MDCNCLFECTILFMTDCIFPRFNSRKILNEMVEIYKIKPAG